MGERVITRDMPMLSQRASFEPSTVNLDKRTVQVTWTTGARVLRYGWDGPYFEELSLDPKSVRMGRLQSGAAPLLNAHSSYDLDDVIGVVEDARLEKGKGTATVRFDTGPKGEDAFRKVREGILRNISVGYSTFKMAKVEDGETTVPVYRAIDWEPAELSLVPIPADAGAVTRSGGRMTPCEFIHQERTTMDPENPTPTPAPAPPTPPTPAPASPDAVRAETERVLAIQRVGRSLGRPDAEIEAAVRNHTPLVDFRAAAQDAFAAAQTITVDKRDPRVEAVTGGDSRDKWLRGASAWIFQRAGVAAIVAEDAKKRGQSVDLDPGEFRGLRMIDLARQALERAGIRTGGMLAMDVIGQALTMRGGGLAGAASTGDFPVLLENTLHKTLLAGYATTPDVWSRFCHKGSVSDFRPHKRYRLGSFGTLSDLTELGEYVNKSIPDGTKESISAGTKGNIIGISRQALINDDLGAFSTLSTGLGRAAKLTIEVKVFAVLAENAGLGPTMGDGATLFHASHNNISTAAALSAAAIDADRVAMGYQKDPSNNEVLALQPAILVVPLGLGSTARTINDSQYDPDTVANKAQMKPNAVRGLFRDIVDTARLAAGTTRRYLFADPSVCPTIEVAFLDGQDMPFMDMQQGWRQDGVEWKVRLDFGVAPVDFRGAVTNAGA
jgi:hypothetical protein